MRAIFSLSCPHWRSLRSTAWASVFHTHSACLGTVHIVLPKSSLLAHVEKGDWLGGRLTLRVVFSLLRFRDLEGLEQDANTGIEFLVRNPAYHTTCLHFKCQVRTLSENKFEFRNVFFKVVHSARRFFFFSLHKNLTWMPWSSCCDS